jgi:hypothetical protein
MPTLILTLLKAAWKALLLLGQFLVILFLGMLTALLYAAPWLLRMACVLGWLVGGYLAIQAVEALYLPHSPTGPVLALQFAVIFMMVAWVGTLLLVNPRHFWGGLALGGALPAGVVRAGIPWLFEQWAYAELFFRVLPPALFSLLIFYLTIRMRFLRNKTQGANHE